jgi:hypothetical protein
MRSLPFHVAIAAVVLLSACADRGGETSMSGRPEGFGTLKGVIVNETGIGIPARVYATGADDSVYAAVDGIEYDRPTFRQRVGYDGRHFTTKTNTFTVHLPAGIASIRIERGKEYVPVEETVVIVAGKAVERKFVLSRFVNMNGMGWYSGDTHVHRSLNDLADLLRAEDLNVAVPQTVWGDKGDDNLESWLPRADSLGAVTVNDVQAFSVLSHEIERFRTGAVFMHFTGKTVIPFRGADDRSPTNVSLMVRAHELGGYAEAEKSWWPESHIDVAVGKADLLGIANNHMLYRSYLPEHPRLRGEYRADYPDGIAGYVAYCLDLYYACLNCGFRPMPSAGSASGVLPNPLGYNRVYVKIDGAFSYGKWFRGLAAGRSFATNGPLLVASFDGADPGGTVDISSGGVVHVACDIHSAAPIDRVEIIRDGEVAFSAKPRLSGTAAHVEADIPFAETGWCAVRCFEDIADNVRFAHTAPVFVTVAGKPFRPVKAPAAYFLAKTDELIAEAEKEEFRIPEARKAVMDVYAEAKKIYGDIVRRGR